jgi:hypothetical protein
MLRGGLLFESVEAQTRHVFKHFGPAGRAAYSEAARIFEVQLGTIRISPGHTASLVIL